MYFWQQESLEENKLSSLITSDTHPAVEILLAMTHENYYQLLHSLKNLTETPLNKEIIFNFCMSSTLFHLHHFSELTGLSYSEAFSDEKLIQEIFHCHYRYTYGLDAGNTIINKLIDNFKKNDERNNKIINSLIDVSTKKDEVGILKIISLLIRDFGLTNISFVSIVATQQAMLAITNMLAFGHDFFHKQIHEI